MESQTVESHKEMKNWIEKMKAAQKQLNNLVKDNWVNEAKRFAERQGKEVRKLIQTDITKVRTFVEREKKDLEKLQKQIPNELNKWKKVLETQKKELTGLLGKAQKASGGKAAKGGKKTASKSKARKSASTARKTTSPKTSKKKSVTANEATV